MDLGVLQLQKALREAIQYYLRLCTRVSTKNIPANAIIQALLEVSNEVVGDEHRFEPTANQRTNTVRDVERMAHLTNKIFSSSPACGPVNSNRQGEGEGLEEASAALSIFEVLFPRASISRECHRSVSDMPWQPTLPGGYILDEYEFAAVVTRTSLALQSRLQDLRLLQQTVCTTSTRFCDSMGVLIAIELSSTSRQPLENIELFGRHDTFMLFQLGTVHKTGDISTASVLDMARLRVDLDFA